MKTRIDFVSNSSSCSFLVEDGKAAIEEIKKTIADKAIPFSFDNASFCLHGQKEVLDSIATSLELSRKSSDDFNGSYELYDLTIHDIMSLKLSQLKNISIIASTESCYDSSVLFVKLLAKILANSNINVEDIGDCCLDLDINDSLMLYLFKKAIDGDKKNENEIHGKVVQ